MTPGSAPASIPVLTGPQLFGVFQQVLALWAYLPADPADGAGSEADDVALGVSLRSDFELLLVVQAPRPLGTLLGEAAGGGSGIPSPAEDPLREMVNVLAGYLAITLWPERRFATFLPFTVQAQDLPSSSPTAACAAQVEGCRVGIRAWIKTNP